MTLNSFIQQVEAMYERLTVLYDASATSQVEVLPAVFKELGVASERLQLAIEEMCQQQEELISTRLALETERQRYQDLFEFAPDAYVVSNLQGIIQQINQAAALLLGIPQHFSAGKPLAVFIAEAERRAFRLRLSQLAQNQKARDWKTQLQQRNGELIQVTLSTALVRGTDDADALLWMMRTEEASPPPRLPPHYDACQDRAVQTYTRGEIIPFQSQTIWQVCQGLVKLSTFAERGEEVLTGLAGPSAIFGPSLTDLPLYQAIALSDVQVTGISLTELSTSPALAQTIFPHVNQRLKQAELLLAIAGQRRVGDRLQALLTLLKQEIGEPIAEGVRLTVRLRHEDLANACGTTRVTITRLFRELQQQGQISIDSKHHIILRN